MTYSEQAAKISTQSENHEGENWDEVFGLCSKADARIAELEEENAKQELISAFYVEGLIKSSEEIESLEAQPAKHQWVSVEDRLPEKDGIYLTKYRGDGRQNLRDEIWIRTYYFGGMYLENWNPKKPHKYTVTHWMPIPPLPEKKEVKK